MPNYVRRDGVLNIASHFPSNTVAPDIGKMDCQHQPYSPGLTAFVS